MFGGEARIVDQRTLKANGKIVPVQEIDGKFYLM